VLQYTLDGNFVDAWRKSSKEKTSPPKSLFVYPKGIAYSNNLIYVVDWTNLKVINLKKEIMSSVILPFSSQGGNTLRIDNERIYLTIAGHHKIYVYQVHHNMLQTNLKLFSKIGSSKGGSKKGEFLNPYGITSDRDFIYICDTGNKRVQLLKKPNYGFYRMWGNENFFENPMCICHYEGILFIGDKSCLKLFTCDGYLVQKIMLEEQGAPTLQDIRDLLVYKNRMYVADRGSDRIHVFRKKGVEDDELEKKKSAPIAKDPK